MPGIWDIRKVGYNYSLISEVFYVDRSKQISFIKFDIDGVFF